MVITSFYLNVTVFFCSLLKIGTQPKRPTTKIPARSKLFTKLLAINTKDELAHRAGPVVYGVPERKLLKKPEEITAMLSDVRLRPELPTRTPFSQRTSGRPSSAAVGPELWDDLLAQIKTVSRATQAPLDYIDWESILGRLSHAELVAWVSTWRSELAKRRNAAVLASTRKLKTTTVPVAPVRTCYDKPLQTLKLQNHDFKNNLKLLVAALDQSAVSDRTAFIALNVLIKQMQFWCPVFGE